MRIFFLNQKKCAYPWKNRGVGTFSGTYNELAAIDMKRVIFIILTHTFCNIGYTQQMELWIDRFEILL